MKMMLTGPREAGLRGDVVMDGAISISKRRIAGLDANGPGTT
jgi:hypothetical protein